MGYQNINTTFYMVSEVLHMQELFEFKARYG